MFVPFLIMLREGLEAALIVSLIASYLKRTQRGRWIGVMWVGVFLAAALCLGLGILINETTGEFPQKEQELFEGIVAVIAVVILTWMVFWMRKVSRNVKVQLEQAVDNALQKGNNHGWALIMMVFFAVAREGDSRLPRGGPVEPFPGRGVRSQQRALHALSDRHPARRYLRLSGNAERQRSGDVLYLSGSGAGAVRNAAAYRHAGVARYAIIFVLVTTYF